MPISSNPTAWPPRQIRQLQLERYLWSRSVHLTMLMSALYPTLDDCLTS